MKVLIADKFDQRGQTLLAKLGCRVFFQPELSADNLPKGVAEHDPDVLIVRSTKVHAEAIHTGRRLKLIIRAGAGYDTIDMATASEEGVFVANCPGKNAIAVAELAWGLILSCDRRIPDQTADLRAGRWDKKTYGTAQGLYGRTLGVLGMGTIALEVVRRARAFGMSVIAWSRSLIAEKAHKLGVEHAPSPRDVAEKSDIVSVHVASTPETRHLINADFIAAMKPGAFLINTTRGAVVDEAALLRGIADKGLRVGLDVYQNEPGSGKGGFDSELARNPSVYGTHHIGASTNQAQQAIADEVVSIVAHYRETGQVLNCVNRAERSPATCILTVRHRNRPGVLANVFQVLSEARNNVEEMENILYQGAQAATARIQLDSAPASEHLQEMREKCSDILSIELTLLADSRAPEGD
ncbi:MAG: 3-phosphoglycerate dehydrogenase family protein [Proteobacteria bacterium]|nr:3-phosphoglycerate dehydrogenase family protein [Pseudomonadota bacterium]